MKRTYDCEFSFSGPTPIPFDASHSKAYKKQYLMTGRNGEVFCFIKEKDASDQQ